MEFHEYEHLMFLDSCKETVHFPTELKVGNKIFTSAYVERDFSSLEAEVRNQASYLGHVRIIICLLCAHVPLFDTRQLHLGI